MATIRFLEVGCADTTIIESQGSTILVDCYNIGDYSNFLPTNKVITAVFITHQHYDHFLGLEYLKENGYSIEYLLHSPYERRYSDNSVQYDEWKAFNDLVTYFKNRGTKVYSPYRQENFDAPYWTVAGLKIWMIGPNKTIASEDTRELHDASLVFKVCGNSSCCFTGDASDKSLNWIANNTVHYCDDILHASHHGSINGADLEFIKKANIVNTIVSTQSGVHQSVPDSAALQRYRTYTSGTVYRTDTNGTIKLSI
jgi:beta-lactamase superfamily II metal-dependent hydrolase